MILPVHFFTITHDTIPPIIMPPFNKLRFFNGVAISVGEKVVGIYVYQVVSMKLPDESEVVMYSGGYD